MPTETQRTTIICASLSTAQRPDLRDAADERIALRPQPLWVLDCLACNAGRLVGKDQRMY